MKIREARSDRSQIGPPAKDRKTTHVKQQRFSARLRRQKTSDSNDSQERQTQVATPQLAAPELPRPPVEQGSATVAPAGSINLPLPIQNLIREIHVYIGSCASAEVQIQFNSQTFPDLRVNIKTEKGSVAVTFRTDNEQTLHLLMKHSPALSQALVNRGLTVSAIRFRSFYGKQRDRR